MKNFSGVCLTLTMLVCGATQLAAAENAVVVDGSKAWKIVVALNDAGAGAEVLNSREKVLEVQDVNCLYTPQGFIWAQCALTDANSSGHSLDLITNKAFNLYTALTDVGGVGEDTGISTSVQATLVTCSIKQVLANNGFYTYSCRIEY